MNAFLRHFRAAYGNATLQSLTTGDALEVIPTGQTLSPSLPVTPALVGLLHLVACYNGDVRRVSQAAYSDLVLASALSLHLNDDELVARSLLLLAVHHIGRSDHGNARSLLAYLEQKLQRFPSAYPQSLHADIYSAVAVCHAMKGGEAAEVEPAFNSALEARQSYGDRRAFLHLLSCRDCLFNYPSWCSPQQSHLACAPIEKAVFGDASYAAAAGSLALAHEAEHDNVSLACTHAAQAVSTLRSLSASPADYRLPLAAMHLAHLLTLPTPPSSPPPLETARATLEGLFSLHSAYPRGAVVYSPVLLSVATEVLVQERDWIASMDVIRQGYEVARGRGDNDEGWRQVTSAHAVLLTRHSFAVSPSAHVADCGCVARLLCVPSL